jgi:hypothetical protein
MSNQLCKEWVRGHGCNRHLCTYTHLEEHNVRNECHRWQRWERCAREPCLRLHVNRWTEPRHGGGNLPLQDSGAPPQPPQGSRRRPPPPPPWSLSPPRDRQSGFVHRERGDDLLEQVIPIITKHTCAETRRAHTKQLLTKFQTGVTDDELKQYFAPPVRYLECVLKST